MRMSVCARACVCDAVCGCVCVCGRGRGAARAVLHTLGALRTQASCSYGFALARSPADEIFYLPCPWLLLYEQVS